MKRFPLLLVAAALLPFLNTARADAPASFLVAGSTTGTSQRFETFVITTSDPVALQKLRSAPLDFTPAVAVRITAGGDGSNRDDYSTPARPWSWRVTEVVGVASQVTAAIYPPVFPPRNLPGPAYSGAPSDIEADVPGWIARNGDVICFERFHLVGEIPAAGAAGAAFLNYSTRGLVGRGEQRLIGGLIISGEATKEVLIRALGPSLAGVQFRVPGTQILVYREGAVDYYGNAYPVLSNSGWQTDPRAAELRVRFPQLVPPGLGESAILVNLPPGSYTVHVLGPGTETGVALLEFYGTRP